MAERLLAESEHFKITALYEEVYLYNKTDSNRVLIGDFYGDAEGAVINKKERFAAVFGCGIIIYFLRPPFEPYSYGASTDQWLEFGRVEPIMWVENVSCKGNVLTLKTEDGVAVIKLSDKMGKTNK